MKMSSACRGTSRHAFSKLYPPVEPEAYPPVLTHQEQGRAGLAGHRSVVTARSVPRCPSNKNPAIADGGVDLELIC